MAFMTLSFGPFFSQKCMSRLSVHRDSSFVLPVYLINRVGVFFHYCSFSVSLTCVPAVWDHPQWGQKLVSPETLQWPSTCLHSYSWCSSTFLESERQNIKDSTLKDTSKFMNYIYEGSMTMLTCSRIRPFLGGSGSTTARWLRNRWSSLRLGNWSIKTSVRKPLSCNRQINF